MDTQNKVLIVNAWNIYDNFDRWLDTVFFDSSYNESQVRESIKNDYVTEIKLKLSWLRQIEEQCEPFIL